MEDSTQRFLLVQSCQFEDTSQAEALPTSGRTKWPPSQYETNAWKKLGSSKELGRECNAQRF